jgi:hypothetical protein
MPANNPPAYTEVLDCLPTNHSNQPSNHWTSAFSTARQNSIAARRSTGGRGRARGRGGRGRGVPTRGRVVSFTCGANHSHRFHCDDCRPPTARLEVNIATSGATTSARAEDLEPVGRSLNPLATPFASRGGSSNRQDPIPSRRRSVSTVRGASPEDTWPGPPARTSSPSGGSPDNSRPSSPVIEPEIQLLRTIDCKLRFQVGDQFSHHRISTIFRRLEYTCSCSKPKNLCSCSSAELTVNLGLRVTLKTELEARCDSPESEV